MRIRAIDTMYKGNRFRSRLEARYAVLMDALGLDYDYEPLGFQFDDGLMYLPDFYIPRLNAYLEVKGVMGEKDLEKIMHMATFSTIYIGTSEFKLYKVERGEKDFQELFSKPYANPFDFVYGKIWQIACDVARAARFERAYDHHDTTARINQAKGRINDVRSKYMRNSMTDIVFAFKPANEIEQILKTQYERYGRRGVSENYYGAYSIICNNIDSIPDSRYKYHLLRAYGVV